MRRIASISVTMAVAAGCLMGVVPDAQATTLPTSLTVVGHGWGHGLGMGQYGALGYASAPFDWSYRQILSHYYGGTVMSTVSPTEPIDVHLDELDGASEVTVATPPGDQLWRNGRPIPSPSTVSRTSSDQTITATRGPSAVDVVVSGPWSSGSQRSFAGAIVLKANVAQVWNVLPLDQYVEGVVPREAPASWPLATLEAQAVAARSYALAVLASSPTATPPSRPRPGRSSSGGLTPRRDTAPTPLR